MAHWVGTLAIATLALAACNGSTVDRGAPPDSLTAPGVIDGSRDEIDPQIVGDRLFDAGETELALASYMRAASRNGLTPDLQMSIALANIRLGRLGQAEILLRELLKEEPENARALNNLGVVLLERDRLGEAHRSFRAAFALQPSPEIRENLRVTSEKLDARARVLAQENTEDTFTLSRRASGVYDLSSPDGLTP